MRLEGMAVSVVFAVALVGCERPADDQTIRPGDDLPPLVQQEPGMQGPAPGATARIGEQMMTGELTSVDLEAHTFILSTLEGDRTFHFSEATAVTGASDAQGLAAHEGARVSVRYREEPGANVALSINLIEQGPQ